MARPALLLALVACAPATAVIDSDTASTAPPGPPSTTAPSVDTDVDTTIDDDPYLCDTPPGGPAPDYRLDGPNFVEVGAVTVQTSCAMDVATFRPGVVDHGVLVILAHGWARSEEAMAGWADHWAGWGPAVATPSLCHASLTDVDHEQNAADLVALAEALAPGTPVIYAGHSAGALAALLAAAQDPDAIGFLGLDLTDTSGLALDAASALTLPARGLLGEPETCNASGNGEAVYAAIPAANALRLNGADHCDFESPTDWGCTTFCADGDADDAEVAGLVLGLSTAALLDVADLDGSAEQWWTPGTTWWDLMINADAITPL